MSYEKPPKDKLFRHLKRNIDDSHNGLAIMFRESSTFHRIYPMMIAGALLLGLVFEFAVIEYVILTGIFVLDVIVETLNSAIEEVCDRITLDSDERIKRSKDIASAAVYIAHLCFICTALFFALSHAFGFEWLAALIPA